MEKKVISQQIRYCFINVSKEFRLFGKENETL